MMEKMRESWTDERIDDLKGEVVEIGRRMDLGFAGIRTELRDEIGSVRGEVGSLQKEIVTRLDSLQRTLIHFEGIMIVALIGLIATQL
jgi:hypothetical protein